MKNKPTSPKISKSLLYYLICGGIAVVIIIGLLLLYAFLEHVDILAWFGTKPAFLMYGTILVYITVGIIIFVKDKIARM